LLYNATTSYFQSHSLFRGNNTQGSVVTFFRCGRQIPKHPRFLLYSVHHKLLNFDRVIQKLKDEILMDHSTVYKNITRT